MAIKRQTYRLPSAALAALALSGLGLATSCVPADVAIDPTPRPRPVTDARVLLKDLALSVPSDVLASPPPLSASTRPAAALRIAPPFLAAARSAADQARARDCLTAAIYYEARSQSADGQRAVAQVVLNRVRDRAFPNSVCGVVYQGSLRRTGCQFSFTCDGSMDRPREPGSWVRARAIAEAALSGSVYAPVGAATFYHANSILPWWAPSLLRVATIGSHIFYRWQGALGNALAFRQRYAGWEPEPHRGGAMQMVNVVRYGADEQFAVTIHRGLGGEQAPAMPHVTTASGVRVHYGTTQAAEPVAISETPSPELLTQS